MSWSYCAYSFKTIFHHVTVARIDVTYHYPGIELLPMAYMIYIYICANTSRPVLIEKRVYTVCCVRSASTDRLVVSSFKLSTIGSRTIKVAAAQTWRTQHSRQRCPFFVKDLKLVCFANPSLTLFHITFCFYPHSGFDEVAVLIRSLNKI